MSIRDIRDRIHQEIIGSQAKQAFLVEGPDDKEAFRILFERFLPGWEQRWDRRGGKQTAASGPAEIGT